MGGPDRREKTIKLMWYICLWWTCCNRTFRQNQRCKNKSRQLSKFRHPTPKYPDHGLHHARPPDTITFQQHVPPDGILQNNVTGHIHSHQRGEFQRTPKYPDSGLHHTTITFPIFIGKCLHSVMLPATATPAPGHAPSPTDPGGGLGENVEGKIRLDMEDLHVNKMCYNARLVKCQLVPPLISAPKIPAIFPTKDRRQKNEVFEALVEGGSNYKLPGESSYIHLGLSGKCIDGHGFGQIIHRVPAKLRQTAFFYFQLNKMQLRHSTPKNPTTFRYFLSSSKENA